MRRALLWVVALALVGIPAYGQKKAAADNKRGNDRQEKREEPKAQLKNAPTDREIERALSRVNKYMPDRTIREDFKDGRVLFTPADLGGLSDEQLQNGFILGYLETDRKKTDAGLESADGNLRKYPVFCRKGPRWEVWFTHQGQAVAKSPLVDGGLDDVHPPVWQNSKRSIWYWRVRFDY